MNEHPNALTLHTLLANYPNTAALKEGKVTSPTVKFDFADVAVANKAFKPLVRDAAFDAGELAIVTFIQAWFEKKPYSLLPVTVVGRGQHHTIAYNPEKGELNPGDLDGRKVGVRAYTQTTGAWVRGILEEEYGVDIKSIRWITFEAPHVAEFKDPAWVQRAPEGKELVQMLLDGEIDAAIIGNSLPDPRLKHLIPNPEEAAGKWAQKHGGIPINHMLVLRQAIATSRPDVVPELYRMFEESTKLADGRAESAALRFGIDANRESLETIIRYALAQGLIPRAVAVDELFKDVAGIL